MSNPNCIQCGRQSYTVGATHCGYCGNKLAKRGPQREADSITTVRGLVEYLGKLSPTERQLLLREVKRSFPQDWNAAVRGAATSPWN